MKTFLEFISEGNPLAKDVSDRQKGIHKIILSAHREGLSPEENKKRQKELYGDLKKHGHVFKKAKGVWKNPDTGRTEHENSVVVHAKGPTKGHGKNLVRLGKRLMKKYDQDAIIHRPPSGKGVAINRNHSKVVYGKNTSYNRDNPYGETHFKPNKPDGKRPKFTFEERT